MVEQALADAFAKGQLRSSDLKLVQIAGRALVYGFARMNIDGHFPRWGVADAEAGHTGEAMVDLFIEGIKKCLASPSPLAGARPAKPALKDRGGG
jgi:hypothetical protein